MELGLKTSSISKFWGYFDIGIQIKGCLKPKVTELVQFVKIEIGTTIKKTGTDLFFKGQIGTEPKPTPWNLQKPKPTVIPRT